LRKSDLARGTTRRILRTGALAVGALALMLLVILPGLAGTLARVMPTQTEERFGRAAVTQMQRFLAATGAPAERCTDPDGQAALDAMTARLIDGRAIPYDLKVLVLDHPMLNAFAAPGGHVVLLRGLLDQTDGPDAVAAVLAHEIGHVASRDPTRNALRVAGSAGILSLILGDVAGGAVLVAVADQMLNSAYSRRAEQDADAYALAMLNDAGISTAAFGAFFDTLAKAEDGMTLPEYLSTHPATDQRAANARANADRQSDTTPALTDAQWRALRQICG
jgi:predicted Zn-dependent protease